MTNVLNILPNAVGQSQATLIYAEVSSTQPTPQSFTDPLYVVIPDWTTDFFFTFTSWPELHGSTLPAAGAAVFLAVDSRGNQRVVWWDAATDAPLAVGATAGGDLSGTYPNPTLAVDRLRVPTGAMVSQTRSLAAAYQPNVTRPTFVLATFTFPSASNNQFVNVMMDAANPPTTVIARPQCSAAATTVQIAIPVSFWVPPAFYYEFTAQGAGGATIASVFELAF